MVQLIPSWNSGHVSLGEDVVQIITLRPMSVRCRLLVVDLAVARTASGTPEHAEARRAQRMITTRLWPELGELLDESDDEEG